MLVTLSRSFHKYFLVARKVLPSRWVHILVIITANSCITQSLGQVAVKGNIDLSQSNFETTTVILNGEWEFYKNELIDPGTSVASPTYAWVPMSEGKKFTHATYRLRVRLPKHYRNIAIIIFGRGAACKLWINTDQVIDTGVSKEFSKSGFETVIAQVPPGIGEALLTIQVSNMSFYQRGLSTAPHIGTNSKIVAGYINRTAISILFMSALLALTTYSFFQFFIYKRTISYLHLSLICIAVCLRSLSMNFLGDLTYQSVSIKIEFAATYSLIITFPFYVSTLFKDHIRLWILKIFIFLGALFLAIVIFFPYGVYRSTLDLAHVVFALEFVYVSIIVGRNFNRRRVDFNFVILGLLIAIPIITLEMLINSQVIKMTVHYLLELAVLQFLFLQAVLLHKKHKTELAVLQKLNEEMDEFLYRTSHDFRTPIASIKGLTQLIQLENTNPSVGEYNSRISSNVIRMDNLLRDIALINRLNKGEWSIQSTEIENIIESKFREIARASGEIDTKIRVENTAPFRSSSELLKEAFDRILDNSVMFSNPAAGVRTIEVVVTIDADRSIILFRDNGIGIESSELEKVFQMFHKASERSTGSGLGLFIAKKIVTSLGGSVEISSVVGAGTEVRVSVPNEAKASVISINNAAEVLEFQ